MHAVIEPKNYDKIKRALGLQEKRLEAVVPWCFEIYRLRMSFRAFQLAA
jgi:hypothetical protein